MADAYLPRPQLSTGSRRTANQQTNGLDWVGHHLLLRQGSLSGAVNGRVLKHRACPWSREQLYGGWGRVEDLGCK